MNANMPLPGGRPDRGEDDEDDIYGLMTDLDALEELLEDLDGLGLTTRDGVDLALIDANRQNGDRMADALVSRLETILAAMDEFHVASREDVEAKLAEFDGQIEAIETGETTFDS
jgi:hypothetical protein